jgi:hypothetical protein
MDRADSTRKAVMSHLRNLGLLGLIENRVGSDDADGGVAARSVFAPSVPTPPLRHGIDEPGAIPFECSRDNATRGGATDIPEYVHGNDSADHDAGIADRQTGASQPRLHHGFGSEKLADGRARASPDAAFRDLCAVID